MGTFSFLFFFNVVISFLYGDVQILYKLGFTRLFPSKKTYYWPRHKYFFLYPVVRTSGRLGGLARATSWPFPSRPTSIQMGNAGKLGSTAHRETFQKEQSSSVFPLGKSESDHCTPYYPQLFFWEHKANVTKIRTLGSKVFLCVFVCLFWILWQLYKLLSSSLMYKIYTICYLAFAQPDFC